MRDELHTERLGRWAKRSGVSYRTAWRWYRNGTLPKDVVAEQMPTGAILVRDERRLAEGPSQPVHEAVIYARINARQSKLAMGEQVETCRSYCLARGWTIKRVVREEAPGLGTRRPKLSRLIEERPPRIVVATPSVVSRFDFRLVEALWQSRNCELLVVDRSEELGGSGGALEDLVDAINQTCHRHYGPKRGAALVHILSEVVEGSLIV